MMMSHRKYLEMLKRQANSTKGLVGLVAVGVLSGLIISPQEMIAAEDEPVTQPFETEVTRENGKKKRRSAAERRARSARRVKFEDPKAKKMAKKAPKQTKKKKLEAAMKQPAMQQTPMRKQKNHRIVDTYCKGIVDQAAEARFNWQAKVLGDLQSELDERIAKLQEETAVIKKWLARREEFTRKAHESLVRIYSGMRPDAASSQLIAMDDETAAAIVIQLDPRIASAILNEMDPKRAARLSLTIAGAAKVKKRRGGKT